MEQKRLLVVDDEQDLCDILLFNLASAGYLAEAAYSAEEAMELVNSEKRIVNGYDLFLLDVMMPGMSGFELAEQLKADERTARTPIIFLTAKDAEDDTLQGFGLGADDYVTKPFSVREVVARVKAVLSRVNQGDRSSILSETNGIVRPIPLIYEGLSLDTVSKTVSIDGKAVSLTRTEFDLLRLLLSHRGEVFSRQQLLEQVWPSDVIVIERTVDVSITRLRKKIGRYAQCIIARQGFGYCFEK